MCDDYSGSTDQSSDAVKVRISGTPKDSKKNCIMIAKKLEEKVTLDKPLGDRNVVDAATGKGVGKG